MKKLIILGLVMFITGPVAAQVNNPSELIGTWQYQGPEGTSTLIFHSENLLEIDGERAEFSLALGVIRIQDEYGYYNYPYMKGDNYLMITFPNGVQYLFQKIAGNQAAPPGKGMAQSSGSLSVLYGDLCSWSGSSSYSSSYSSTARVRFDGKGNFQFSSEGSFSSDAGSFYSGDGAGGGEYGTYQIRDNTVYLHFPDGTIEAQVYMRQDNGMITELMCGETLYAAGLCE